MESWSSSERQELSRPSRRLVLAAATALPLAGAGTGTAHAGAQPRGLSVRGADISFTLQEEAVGNQVRDLHGRVRPIERILRAYGGTHVRLRVWTDPPPGYSDLDSALELGRRAHRAGLRILLNLHYSDFWADPGKQPTPVAWRGQDLPTLAETVRRYTREVVAAFVRQRTPVDMIQIGNEITSGMLHPVGELYPTDGRPPQWSAFTTLLKAGITGAREGAPRAHRPRVMLHIDRGGDNGGARWFFDHMVEFGVPFDIIGLSYYPIWHGPLVALQSNLHDLAARYDKDIVVVETAYPWTTENGDELTNFYTGEVPLPDEATYPPTPQGQAGYFEALREILLGVPRGRGLGFFDFEPGWLPGVGWEPGAGTPNDNLTMFDFEGYGLPSLHAFRPPHARGNRAGVPS
ncbi:glycoside hydrolase family 53 protein [Thermasporomyces composti]|uniref:Arabinogalactan endo-beta-1,4-galactanase n=1 Tax=Thermasporomyces composti TaxID=696763 RepID=A0A3D9VDS4_THECX|nr:glycosyl hydrolase 53 family protein [Thermasporomyces composti]REF37245.1 arabinogalactan endo-1,4-beta-galactosidase [Thermasporomyces composti]